MKRPSPHPKTAPIACAALLILALIASSGLTALAAEGAESEVQQVTPPPTATEVLPHNAPEDTRVELYPADIQTIIDSNGRQIVRTYILTAELDPADIPRDSFERRGWRYTLTDIIERRTSSIDTRSIVETVEINTDSNDLNEIIALLSPTIEYLSEDGYTGSLALDLASVNCEEAGRRNSSFTVTATREYPHLSHPDTSLLPKTITENGRTLTLDRVSWEAQNYTNVDYVNIPDSYRAIATYTANASRSVVTGYITTAEYSGEIAKLVVGETIYTAYFTGIELNPAPIVPPEPEPEPEPETEPEQTPPEKVKSRFPLALLLVVLTILAALAVAAVFLHLRRNVKVYRDDFSVLIAKDKIGKKNMVVDLSPLEGKRFGIEIDAMTAKPLNGQTIEVIYHVLSLKHKIAYEGNPYRIDVDTSGGTIKAIY